MVGVGSLEGSPLGVGDGVGVVSTGLTAMVMMTLVPLSTLVFGLMLCWMTVPSTAFGSGSWVRPTLRPSCFRVLVASAWVWVVTSGTSTFTLPVEIVSVNTVPAGYLL